MSYSIECCVSHQVIAEGDKCLAIPILQESTYNPVKMTLGGRAYREWGPAKSVCHPGAHWAPLNGFVTGTYDDYGYVKPEDTPTNRIVIVDFYQHLMRKAPVVSEGANPSHEIVVDFNALLDSEAPTFAKQARAKERMSSEDRAQLDFDELAAAWAYLWRATHEHRLFCQSSQGGIRPVQFAVFHQSSFNHLVQYASKLSNWEGCSFELGVYLEQMLKEISPRVADAMKEILPRIVDAAEDTTASEEFRDFFTYSVFKERLGLEMSDCTHNLLFPFWDEHLRLLSMHLRQKLTLAEYVEAMRPSMEGIYALKGMDRLNFKFSPVIYAGQDYHNDLGQEVVKFITAVSQEVTELRKKHYE